MSQNHKVALTTLGCKLNFSETSTISRQFEDVGYSVVKFDQFSDVYVINTCSVTENADKQFKSYVSKALKLNPEAFLIAIGCYAQLKPEELAKVNGVDLVLGSKEKFKILDYLNDLKKNNKGSVHSCEIKETDFYQSSYSIGERTRSFLKVQDGCDYFCSFCTIPLARGKSRNVSIQETVAKAKEVASKNIKEIVLTGVNIGDFGAIQDYNETFYDLLVKLDKVEGIDRFRISSIEPNLLSDEIIDFVAQSNKIVPHFHIPLQSGNDEILTKMRRKYLSSLYEERISRIKSKMPNCCIGVDVIVGFPGESEEHFLSTYDFINSLDVSYLHVFPYSERNNTTAKKLPNKVSKSEKTDRAQRLRILSAKKKRHFYESQISKTMSVLWEEENHGGDLMQGFSENYIRFEAPYDSNKVNKIDQLIFKEIAVSGLASSRTQSVLHSN